MPRGQKKAASVDPFKSVVEVTNKAKVYDYTHPYNGANQSAWRGSGVVVEGQGILTNAHVASDAEELYVHLAGYDKPFRARVDPAGIGHDCDLAMLRIDDPEFWARAQPVEIMQDAAELGSAMEVYGFPMGGDHVNMTAGRVGRTFVDDYAHSGVQLMVQQTDAPINPGNSGGPAFVNGKIAGIAFQGYPARYAENLGYVIPAPVIQHYIKQVNEGNYRGFPELDVDTQPMVNETFRKFLGMRRTDSGLLVKDVPKGSNAYGILRADDIIVSIDGQNVSNFGNVSFDGQRIVGLSHIANMKYVGDNLNLEVLRNNEVEAVSIPLDNAVSDFDLVPMEHDKAPTYYANAGLVIQPLTNNYFESLMGMHKQTVQQYGDKHPLAVQAMSEAAKLQGMKEQHAENLKAQGVDLPSFQICFMSTILRSPGTHGYGAMTHIPILSVNGRPILNMADIVKAMEGQKESTHTVFLGDGSVVMVPNLAKADNDVLNATNGIYRGRSADLNDIDVSEDNSDSMSFLQMLMMAAQGPEGSEDNEVDADGLWPDEGPEEDPDYDPEADSQAMAMDLDGELTQQAPAAMLHSFGQQPAYQTRLQDRMKTEQQAEMDKYAHLRMQL